MRTLIAAAVLVLIAASAFARPPQAPTPPQAPAARGLCSCGDACACPAGVCPAKCPAVAAPAGDTIRTVSGRVIRWTGSGYVYADEAPQAFTAPTAPQTFAAPVSGGCVNGQCQIPTTRRR